MKKLLAMVSVLIFGFGLACSLGVLPCYANPAFEASSSSAKVIVEFSIHSTAFFGDNVPRIKIFGDGSVEVFRPFEMRGRPPGTFRMNLGREGLRKLLSRMAGQGVFEMTTAELEDLKRTAENSELTSPGEVRPRPSVAGGYVLDISLESYRSDGLASPVEGFDLKLLVSDIGRYGKHFPEIREFSVLFEVWVDFRGILYHDDLILSEERFSPDQFSSVF